MKESTLRVKGMGVPRIFIWMLGVFHGRIIKTAGIDEETGYICSSYVVGKCKLFEELSSKRVKRLEQELKAVRLEAFQIMTEEAKLKKCLDEDVAMNSPASINEKRATGRCEARRKTYTEAHNKNLKRLGEIGEKINSCELNAKEELDAVASAVQSRFATYAHGMLFRPIRKGLIPPVEYDYCFELYKETHRKEDTQRDHWLEEVLQDA